jgi:enoyl-CoA hydratase/carnithine racemase
MELVITGRRIDVREAERIGLVNEVVARGRALERAQELAHQVAALPQGAIRSDKESIMRGVGRTLEERLRIEAEMVISMFMRRDSHTIGAGAFKAGNLEPEWPNHGL